MNASDSATDHFSYVEDWATNIGMGGAFTTSIGNGTIEVTLTVNNPLAALSAFCFDIQGASNYVIFSQGYAVYPNANNSRPRCTFKHFGKKVWFSHTPSTDLSVT